MLKMNISPLLILLVLSGCVNDNGNKLYDSTRVLPQGCELWGQVVYDSGKIISTESDAKGVFLAFKPEALFNNEELLLHHETTFDGKFVDGWLLPPPYSIKYSGNTFSGLLVGKDGKIYSFNMCE